MTHDRTGARRIPTALLLLLALSCSRGISGASFGTHESGRSQLPPKKSVSDLAASRKESMKPPKQECEDLMNAVLPIARKMLVQYREFFPFGGTMSASGEIAQVSGWTGDEHPPSSEVIALLTGEFRDGAAVGKYRATALVYDVRVVPPGASTKQDAIAVNLDHESGYSVVVMFPYSFSTAGELIESVPFATPGTKAVFPP